MGHEIENLIDVKNFNGIMVVSSRQIAQDFEKEHRVVLKAIRDLIDGGAQNYADLFIESQYQSGQNKQWYPEYLCSRDGFALLGMGFTGSKAIAWKLKYIEAFNLMEKRIQSISEKFLLDPAIASSVASLARATERIMKSQGSTPYEVAKVYEMHCKQFGIKLPNGFVKTPEKNQMKMGFVKFE